MSRDRESKGVGAGGSFDSYLPMKPVWFHILLTLASGERHGYAIRQEVEERTDGAVKLWPTTLYGTLARLEGSSLIEESEGEHGPADDIQRRFYRLTSLGRGVLAAETDRLAELVRESRARQARMRPGEAS